MSESIAYSGYMKKKREVDCTDEKTVDGKHELSIQEKICTR